MSSDERLDRIERDLEMLIKMRWHKRREYDERFAQTQAQKHEEECKAEERNRRTDEGWAQTRESDGGS